MYLGILGVTHEFLQNFQRLLHGGSFIKLGFIVFILLEKEKYPSAIFVVGNFGGGSTKVIGSKPI
jgi:hypothetical protein